MTPQKYTYRVVLLLCCLYTSSVVKGQGTCSSSALAPVFSQTFGQGANSSSKTTVPSGFTTNYSFQSSGALDDGRYIVTPRVQNSNRDDWAVGTDHTGNSNGNMFLVNAGTGGSVFFTQQVDNLCPGSTYNFSAWLANVNTTSHTLPICGSGYVYPNVTFNIKNTSGTLLATYNTGNLPLTANRSVAPNWQQYGFSFALPTGTTSLILEMVDAYGGQPQCGNDLAIDDILFTACTPTATISFSNGTTVCAGTSTTINAAIVNNPFTSPTYQWQKSTDGGTTWSNIGTASTSSSYTINSVSSNDGAAYRVIVGPDVASLSSSTCITASAAVTLTVASVKLNDDVIECNNGITSYSASDPYYKVTYSNTNAGNSYLWSVSSSGSWSFQGAHSPSSQYPRFQFNSSAAYAVSVQFTTNGVSCSDTQVVFKNAVALASILNSKDTSICYNTNSVTLSGSVSYVTNNYTWSTSGTGSFSNANSLNPTYTPSLADKLSGLVKLYFTGTSTYNATGNCGSNTSIDSMTLRIYPNNTGTNTTSAICSNQLLTHTPSSTQPGSTFLWTSAFTSGAGSGNTASGSGNISNLLVNASSTTAAVVTYTITPYYGGCAGEPYTLTVTVNPNPTLIITNTTTEICSGVATNIQLSSSLTGSLFSWTSSIVSGTASGHSSNATASSVNTITDIITNTSTSNAIIRYRITTVSPSGCTRIDSTDITIKPNPTTAAAGTDQQLCNLSSTQLNANTPVVGNGSWTMASGPSTVTFSNASLATSTVSGMVPGTYVFVWSISNSPCAVSRDSVNVIISPETVAGTLSNNMNVCFGSNSGTLTLAGYTGNIIRWEFSTNGGANWTSITNTSNTHSFNNLTASTIFRAVVQSGSCSSQFSNTVTVTVDPLTVPGTLSGTTTVCSGSNSGVLTLSGYTGNIIRWEASTDGGLTWPTSYAVNTNTYTFSNLTQTTTFRAVVQSGSCSIEYSNAITVTVSPLTVPGTLGNNATVCATANNGSLTLNGYNGTILNWEFSVNNGSSWSVISNTSNTQSYTNLTTTTQYRVSVQSGVCAPQYSNTATVTVVPPVETPNAGNDFGVCNVAATTLNATAPSSGSGSWLLISGPSAVNFTNAADAHTTVNGLVAGTYQFEWTISNGVCTNLKDTVIVTVYPATVPGTLSASTTVCATANNGTLSLAGFTGNILHWEASTDNGTSWTNISNTTNTLNFTNLSSTTQYRVSVQSGVCAPQYSNIITVTVLPAVTTANAGADQSICNVTGITLNGNNPTSGAGTWSVLPGAPSTVTFTNAASHNTTVTGMVAGTYQFVWTISNGTCTDSKDTVQVVIHPPSVPGNITAEATVCAIANNGTLTLIGNTGNVIRWESSTDYGASWTTLSNTTNTLDYDNLSSTTTFRAAVQNQNCPALYTNLNTITVLQPVTPANAGPDTTFINGVSSYTLTGNMPSSGTGVWSVVPGATSPLNFSGITNPKATITGLDYVHGTPPTDGKYLLVWTISNGYCPVSTDTMQITVQPPTNPGIIGPDAVVCTGNNSGTLQLTDYLGTILQWELSVTNGATWTVISSTIGTNQDTYTYNNLTQTTLFRALVKNGVGAELYSGIAATVTVLELVTPANAGPDQFLCNTTSTTLAGNSPTSGMGTWSALPGNPTAVSFSNAADPNSVVSGLSYGTYQFVWTISNGICSDSQDIVAITIQQPTIAGSISADNTVCVTSNNGTLQLTGFFGSIVQTEYSTDNGITWAGVTNTANQSTISYTNLTQTTQYRSQIKNGVCPALVTNIVTVTVLPEVTPANAGADQVLCNTTAATLNANNPTSGTGIWTVLPGAPSTVSFTNAADPATTVNGLTHGTYRFVWTISNTLCASSSDIVEIRIVPPTIAGNLVASATVCATNNTDILTLSGNNGSIIRWEYSTNNGGSWNNISNTTSTYTYNNLNTTTTYRALNQNEICSALYSNDVTITVIPPVTPANAGTDQVLCNVNAITLNGNTPTSGTGTWTLAAGAPSTVSFTNANDPNTTVNGLIAGTYQFVWTIGNGMCAPSADTVIVKIDPLTIPGSLVADATVCATANGNILSLNGYTGDILRWELSTLGNASWTNITNTTNTLTYSNLNTTTTYRVVVQSGSCTPLYSNEVTITVLQPVTAANAGADQLLCNAVTTVLEGNQPVSGTGAWTHVSGPTIPVFANATDPRTAVNGLTVGTYVFVWTITNNLCIDSKDTVQITIAPVTVPGVLSSNATVCSGTNNGSLELSGTTGSVLHWEYSTDNGISWTVFANTSNTYTYTNLTASTLFRVLVQNSVCATAYSNPVQITVMPQVTPAVAGLNQALCNSSIARLEGNTPSSGVGMWSQTSGPTTAIFADAGLAATNVSGLSTGTYRFAWTISNAVCASSSDEVELRIDPSTSAGILSGNDTVCTNINTGTLSIANYTGTIIRWESSIDNGTNWSSINSTQNTYNYTNLTATTRFRVLVQSGVCASLYSNTVTITVNPLTVGGHIVANDTVCVTSNNGTLQLTNYVGDLIRWESSINNGNSWTLINYTGDQYNFSNLLSTTLFRVMVQSGVCSAAFSDTVNIVVDAATVAGTLSRADTVCYNNNSGQVILSGKLGSVIQWESSENSGAIWSPINTALTDTIRYNNLQRTTLYRSLVKNGTCAVMYTTPIEIAVVEPVTTANAGDDIVVCNAASFTTLRANTALSGTGRWRQIAGPNNGSIADATNPNTTVSGLIPGIYEFAWEISNGICVSSSDTVSVRVDRTIADFTLSGANNCGNTVYRFNDRSQSNFGIAAWKWSIAPGDTVYQKENSIKFTSEGTYTMNLSVVSNIGCVNTLQAQFSVNVFEFPQVDIDAIRDVCKGQLTQLAPIVNSKDTIAMLLWNLGNGTRSSDSVIAVRYLIDGQYTVRLTATTVNNCFDSAYKAMTVHPLPVINITPNSTICKGDSIRLIASGARHYIWFDQLNNITATGTNANIVRPTGTTTVRVIGYDEHGCSEIKSTSIRVIQPLKMFAAQGDTLCIGESKQLIATGASSYRWYPETGLNNTQVANPVARPVETTVYNVIGKDAYNCFTDTAQIKVVVGRPTPINIGRDTIITAGTSFQLRVLSTNTINGGNDQIKKWRWGGDVSISCPTCPAPEVKLSNDACISCTVVNNYGCVSTDTICIKTLCPATELFVPNAFSPDGDGVNDVLLVQGKGIKLIKSFRIYNRWGQLVFEKANFSPGDPAYAWNGTAFGKAVTPDVFVYVSEVICEKGLPTTFKGNITILK